VFVSLPGRPRRRENGVGCLPTPMFPWVLSLYVSLVPRLEHEGCALLP